jgi:cysteinyl-tRNA synthetase
MKLYNSLTRQVESFIGLDDHRVGVYTCGPTVYSYLTIGNWRTYTLSDVLVRTLEYLGYQVDYVMNITDVGHLTGDNFGDADTGEDRMEKASKKEGKTAWDVAEYYTNDFLKGYGELSLIAPKLFCKATEHILEQIELIERLEKNGLVYRIRDGIYFDVLEYERQGNVYGELSTLDQIQEGARVTKNEQKRDPRDFALWKFSVWDGDNEKEDEGKRQMEWESPWGVGFPGWHIECSAMGMKYLGEQFDIHVGGEDLRSTHHPNEIAQSEGATLHKPFVKYWLHGAFLLVDGGRMGKSLGNAYTLADIKDRGFEPMDLRYFYFGGHYRKQLNFTWEALAAARAARLKLVREVAKLDRGEWGKYSQAGKDLALAFENAITMDLNMPEAMAVVWQVLKVDIDDREKRKLLLVFDRILGLGLDVIVQEEIPDEVLQLVRKRNTARQIKDFALADKLRVEVELMGYEIEDIEGESRLRKKDGH